MMISSLPSSDSRSRHTGAMRNRISTITLNVRVFARTVRKRPLPSCIFGSARNFYLTGRPLTKIWQTSLLTMSHTISYWASLKSLMLVLLGIFAPVQSMASLGTSTCMAAAATMKTDLHRTTASFAALFQINVSTITNSSRTCSWPPLGKQSRLRSLVSWDLPLQSRMLPLMVVSGTRADIMPLAPSALGSLQGNGRRSLLRSWLSPGLSLSVECQDLLVLCWRASSLASPTVHPGLSSVVSSLDSLSLYRSTLLWTIGV